jgi:hypothetical protein
LLVWIGLCEHEAICKTEKETSFPHEKVTLKRKEAYQSLPQKFPAGKESFQTARQDKVNPGN